MALGINLFNYYKGIIMDIGILYVVYNEWIRDPKTNGMPYKIGITRGSVEDRYYGLGLKMPGKFETLFAYSFNDCGKAEQLMHGLLNEKRENGEWFNVNEKELDLIKSNCELMGGKPVTEEIEKQIETETGTDTDTGTDTGTEAGGTGTGGGKETKITTQITARDLLNMKKGEIVYDFFNLIVESKVPNSRYWGGEQYQIRNTPMKGINWIGNDNRPLAVIIKTTGKYTEDSEGKTYAFEAKNGQVDKTIKSNKVIINQKKYNYPILYFIKQGLSSKYIMLGKYSVKEIFGTYVTLGPYEENK